MAKTRKKVDFEDKLKGLEDIVRQLEDGALPLEASLSAFEQGVKLTRECQAALDSAQQKVQLLTATDNSTQLTDFESKSDAP